MELHNQVIISMDSLMELVAEAAAKTAIGVYNEEHQMKQKERRRQILRNTKLLLENYRSFKTHISRSVYDLSTATESAVDLLDMMWDGTGNTLNIQSIKQSVLRTAVIMDHITKMLKIYKGNPGKPRNPHETGGSGSWSQPIYNTFTTFAKTGRALICHPTGSKTPYRDSTPHTAFFH